MIKLLAVLLALPLSAQAVSTDLNISVAMRHIVTVDVAKGDPKPIPSGLNDGSVQVSGTVVIVI